MLENVPPLDNCRVVEATPLVAPATIKAQLPLSPAAARTVWQARQSIRDVIHGRDPHRLLVIVGPCSIHDAKAAYEYAGRLKALASKTEEDLLIIMRAYTEKPRTTVGWKGLINDPHLDGSCDIAEGLRLAREILLTINDMGMPCATEVLDPVTPQYLSDLVSWAAIGARTIESQTHREMASGLSMPVGFKNGTDGRLSIAMNAIVSARHPHSFLGVNQEGQTAVIKTSGNPDRHLVLRGGGGKPNYSEADVNHAVMLMAEEQIARPVMVDCSHDNSQKDHTRQGAVAREVVRQFVAGQRGILGIMLESHLFPGKQTWQEGCSLRYGVSITDACIGWEETEALLLEIAEHLRSARVAQPSWV
ncbi:MAG: 3-deoxy-7-phosphoheptulonate synthase [Thermostichales cyanobacterium SZTDM-1c_bins_54]